MEYTQFTETRWFRMANGNKLWSQSPLILAYYMRELSGPRVSFAIARPLSRRKQFRLISSSIKRNTTRACRIGFSMRFQANIYQHAFVERSRDARETSFNTMKTRKSIEWLIFRYMRSIIIDASRDIGNWQCVDDWYYVQRIFFLEISCLLELDYSK